MRGRRAPAGISLSAASSFVLRARDQRRQICRHACLEQRVAGHTVVGGARIEEVDTREPVDLQIDEAGDGDAVARSCQPDRGHDSVVHVDVPRHEGAVDQCRFDAQSHRASLRAIPGAGQYHFAQIA